MRLKLFGAAVAIVDALRIFGGASYGKETQNHADASAKVSPGTLPANDLVVLLPWSESLDLMAKRDGSANVIAVRPLSSSQQA